MAAVKNSGSALEYVPEAMKTEELCITAVQNASGALQYVPEALKTEAICIAAVQEDKDMLKYVPIALKDKVKKATPDAMGTFDRLKMLAGLKGPK